MLQCLTRWVIGGRDSDAAVLDTSEAISNIVGCTAPTIPYSAELLTGAFDVKNGVMVCGGRDPIGDLIKNCMRYDPQTNQWMQTTDLPTSVMGAASGWMKQINGCKPQIFQ